MAVYSLFGGEVVGCSQHVFVIGNGERGLFLFGDEPSQTKIENLHDAFRIHQKIRRLDIPMNEAHRMCVVKAPCRLPDVLRRRNVVECAGIADDDVQVQPIDVLHDQIVGVSLVVDIVRTDDIDMIESSNGLGFTMESFKIRRILVGPASLGEHLDGHSPMHEEVLGKIDTAHASRPQMSEQLVLPNDESLVAPFEQLVGLPSCEQFLLHQAIGDCVGGTSRQRFIVGDGNVFQFGDECGPPVVINQFAFRHQVQKFVDGELGHK